MKKIVFIIVMAFMFTLISHKSFSQIPTYSISQVKNTNTQGVADSLNVYCKMIGVINSINYTTTGLQFYILDQTNGIYVYKSSALTGYTFTKGDSIRVIGLLSQVNGMLEIVPDSIVVLASNGIQQSPITINQLTSDTLESRLVKFTNLKYLSGWSSGGTTRTVYTLHGVDTIIYRFTSNCNIRNTAAPTATVTFSLAGFDNQSATTTPPYVGGYRLYPRDSFDLVINYTNPVILTNGNSLITQNSATVSGNIVTDGGHAITTKGFCYDTLASADTTKAHITVSGNIGTYSGNISGLLGGKTYHYRAYCINSTGVYYGNDTTFTTSAVPVLPIVTTYNVTNYSYNYAVASGLIVSNGGDTVITKGICWSTNSTPTLSDSVHFDTGTANIYSDTLKNLTQNTTYYARAFATTAVGTGYGNIVSFTTVKLPTSYSISQIRTVNANGVADSLNVNCKLVGVVHSVNYGATTSLAFYICDANSGIYVYRNSSNLGYTVKRGDMLRVIGKITQVNGLIEIAPDSIVVISSGNTLNTPIVVTTLSEANESQLIKMTNLYYLSGWPTTAGGTATVRALHNNTDTITLMISRYSVGLQGKPAPVDTFTVIGMESQNDASSPYLTGYTIYPRDSMDIIITGPLGINELATKPIYNIYPNPGNGNFKIAFNKNIDAEIRIFSMIGTMVEERTIKASDTDFNISAYGKGMYLIEITDTKTGLSTTEKLIVQ